MMHVRLMKAAAAYAYTTYTQDDDRCFLVDREAAPGAAAGVRASFCRFGGGVRA